MPPKSSAQLHTSPRMRKKTTPKAKASPKRVSPRLILQQRIRRSNTRRAQRVASIKLLNDLAAKVSVAHMCVREWDAPSEDIERLVRALESRMADPAMMQQLHDASKAWQAAGGVFSTDILQVDLTSQPVIPMHRVLMPTFKLKSKAFMLTFHSADFTEATWPAFLKFVKDLKKTMGARAWAACLERSLERADTDRHHTHAYLFWTDGVGIDVASLDPFYFQGVRPRVDVCQRRVANTTPHLAACHGVWYVSIFKEGTVQADTNFAAGVWYKPKPAWLESLFREKKLNYDAYVAMSARDFPVGHANRKRDAQEAIRDVRKKAVEDAVAKEVNKLKSAGSYKKRKAFQEVDEFQGFFDDTPRWRRPVLLIIGTTNLGKSMLAGAVLEELGMKAGVAQPGFLEITMEEDGHLDFAELNTSKHVGVILDGVADTLLLKKHRETLQGRPKILKGAKSATMKFAYAYTLCRVPIIATMDTAASNLELLDTDKWLSDRRNILPLRLAEPAWQDASIPAPSGPAPAPLSKYDEVANMTCAELMCMLQKADLVGPAEILFRNGVNGQDLINMTPAVLAEELRLSPFAARKVLAARDAAIA